MSEVIPIACYLTDRELQARRKNHLDKTVELLVDSTEIEHGFIYKFLLKPATRVGFGGNY